MKRQNEKQAHPKPNPPKPLTRPQRWLPFGGPGMLLRAHGDVALAPDPENPVPLIKEYALNYRGLNNQGALGSLGSPSTKALKLHPPRI